VRYFAIGLLVVAFAATGVWADLSSSAPTKIQTPYYSGAFSNTPADEQGSRGQVNVLGIRDLTQDASPLPVRQYFEERGSQNPPSILWGTDVLVGSRSNPGINGQLAVDHYARNGEMYVSVKIPKTGSDYSDSIHVYRSVDGGDNWTLWNYATTTSGVGHFRSIDMVAGDTLIHMFIVHETFGLYMARRNPDAGNLWYWTPVVTGDSVLEVSAVRSTAVPYDLFVSVLVNNSTGGRSIYAYRSTDLGLTWIDRNYVSTGIRNSPKIATAGDNYFYISYMIGTASDTETVRIGRNTSNLGGTWVFNDVDAAGEGDWTPSVAGARTTPGTSQSAWTIWRHMHSNGRADVHYATSTNGGAAWTQAPWPPTNLYAQVDDRHPLVKLPYENDLVRGIASIYPPAVFDSLVYAFSRATSPTTWEERGIHNDYTCTGEFGARADYSSLTSGGWIAYRQYGSANIWSDAWNHTGVEKGEPVARGYSLALASASPNPLSKSTSIAFSLPKSGSVDLTVYDIAGRKVATLAQGTMSAGSHEVSWNGAKAPAGVYLYRLSFEGKTLTNRMVVVR